MKPFGFGILAFYLAAILGSSIFSILEIPPTFWPVSAVLCFSVLTGLFMGAAYREE